MVSPQQNRKRGQNRFCQEGWAGEGSRRKGEDGPNNVYTCK
jgi:hypothetical protein